MADNAASPVFAGRAAELAALDRAFRAAAGGTAASPGATDEPSCSESMPT
jgi:hypothetical protein